MRSVLVFGDKYFRMNEYSGHSSFNMQTADLIRKPRYFFCIICGAVGF